MKLTKKIKNFIIYLRSDISKSFFFSQAPVDQLMIDNFWAFVRRLKSLDVITGSLGSDIVIEADMLLKKFEKNKKKSRSIGFSEQMELEDIPATLKKIISKHESEITKYLGKDFLYENPLIWRNYNFDPRFSGCDIYSNIWHQDSHDGNRILKIFVLLNKVTESDGPFFYLPEYATRKYWDSLKDRWGFHTIRTEVQGFDEAIRFIGDSGDYQIIDTSRHMHRAGIPASTRDILQITLYPSWRKRNDRNKYKISLVSG